MSRPLREVTTYLVLAFSLAIGVAVAMPHAGINVLLSAFIPVTAVLIITFTATPRGRRRELWGSFGLKRSGKSTWAFALARPDAPGRQSPTPPQSCSVSPSWPTAISPHGARRLDPEPVRDPGLHDGALPGRGDRLARLHAAAGPAAHQPPAGRTGHRLRPRLLPPAADPDRDDVRRVRHPLVRRPDGGRRRSPWVASSTPTSGTGPAASGRSRWPTAR